MKRNFKIVMLVICTLAVTNFISGQSTTYYGTSAGTGGTYNSNFGYYSGYPTTGTSNSIFGSLAGRYNTTGASNVFLGRQSGYSNVSGGSNTFLGTYSGFGNISGGSNVFIGGSSAYFATTGSQNVFIGYASGQNNGAGTGNIFIGSYSGQNATGSNKLFIDNSNTSSPLIYGDFDSSYVTVNGRMGIGTRNIDASIALKVNGTIVAKEVLITVNNFPDFVFKKDYSLMPLKELDDFIKKWSHLPLIPAEKQVLDEGLNLAEMNKLLLQKVEELTLYIIEQDKRITELEKKLSK